MPRLPNPDLTFDAKNQDSGFIVGSLSFLNKKARHSTYTLIINPLLSNQDTIMDRKIKYVNFSPNQIISMRHNGDLDNKFTYLFAVVVPKGRYEIDGINLHDNMGYLQTYGAVSFGDARLDFQVNGGEILYVGNITLNEWKVREYPLIFVQDKYEIDIKRMKEILPSINWTEASTLVIRDKSPDKIQK